MDVLLVDDEESITKTLSDDLEAEGHKVEIRHDGNSALSHLRDHNQYDCVVTDLRMPGLNGMNLLKKINEARPDIYVVVITGYGTVDSAVEAMKHGAFDYLQKPFMNEEVVNVLDRIQEFQDLRSSSRDYRTLESEEKQFEQLVGRGEAMQEVFKTIETLSDSEVTVLLQGESGTGKELVAEAIHSKSPRSDGPLIKFSCAGFPKSLIDAELFGHEKGAFTGAVDSHEGRFQRADGGTIFLDDIDDMDLDTQTKFLRVLQEQEIEKLGAEETIPIDIRVITSSKVDLKELVDDGQFREDLYYRLNVVNLYLPPLRERKEDIPLLARHFMDMYASEKDCSISDETLSVMKEYDWPGNVRELENAVQRAIALAGPDGKLKRKYLVPESMEDFDDWIDEDEETAEEELPPLKERLDQTRKKYVKKVLKKTDGERKKAADILDISRKTLWKYMKKYDIDV